MKKNGFTLAEMIVATAIGVTILLIFGILFIKSMESCGAIKSEVNIQKEVRRALYQLAAELRRTTRSTINFPTANSISFELPVFQISVGSCSAHAINPLTTAPVSCPTDTNDCVAACGGVQLDWSCRNKTCYRPYTYSIAQNNGISQLVSSATGETSRVLGNNVQTMTFQTSGAGSNLRSNEIGVQMMTQEMSDYEKRVRQETLRTIVQVRKS